ncbi:DoxX family protein [Planctomicrobium piriforme]|uniref:Uncharacterized membrane protein n=1 Tax=Planctomicrobium piriforme TaxID=1576369 RepID=A0A1I3BH89_9PLAN|nr:hypothetical protein [Planctomicrobium piriforme]SFH61299.1 Uncharacterized membrane protein [Planctomicrobium piriforme]
MKLLIVMFCVIVGPWAAAMLLELTTGKQWIDPKLAGCLGVTCLFLLTGVGHFFLTQPMARMLPAWVPAKVPLVYITGMIELAAAVLILVPQWRAAVGWGLIVMLALFLPVNIYAAVKKIPIGGHEFGMKYLAIRIPLQFFLMWWIWRFAVA